VTLIPEFSAVRLSVASGMLGASDQEWTDFVSMFALAVRHVHYYHIDHCPGTTHCALLPHRPLPRYIRYISIVDANH